MAKNSLGEAVLDLAADSSRLNADVQNAKGLVLGTLGQLGAVGGLLFGAGLAVAGAGILLLGKGLTSSVQEAIAAEKVQAQLNATLQSTAHAAGYTANDINFMADQLSNLTGIDDEAIVSAESLMLTFTNIGRSGGVFPQATQAALDMSTAMGTDLQSSVLQIGKALNDPIEGMSALQRVGVTFNAEQEKMIKNLQQSGDLEGAQAIILQELQKEFGGSAEAAGNTFAGQLGKLQTAFGNIKETVGNALLPVLGKLATMFGEYLNRPETKAFIEGLAKSIGDFAMNVAASLPVAIQYIKDGFGWFQDNQGVVIAALAAIGVAILAFGITVAIAVGTAMAPLIPVIAVMALVGAAAYLLYEAWTNNWGGIRDAVMQFWTVIQPYFQMLVDWLQVQIPLAIQWMANFWRTVLLPAIQEFFAFVATVVIPNLINLVDWLAVNVPAAINTLVTWWNDLKTTVSTVMANFKTQVQSGIALVINHFNNFIVAGGKIIAFLKGALSGAFDAAGKAIGKVVSMVNGLLRSLQRLAENMPGFLMPGSPTPFEIGLWGIHDAMRAVAKMALPQLGGAFDTNLAMAPAAMSATMASDGAGGAGSGNQYVFNMQKSDLNEDQLMRALRRAEVMYG